MHLNPSLVLKISLFATGCAGIVAEFVLSTLATYLMGNAIFQWTIVMSLMLFAMGVGSRLSRFIHRDLLDYFIITEFVLSVLCAVSAVAIYALMAFTAYYDLLLYATAFVIGSLIGLEIPLVTRMNEEYEDLRINISAVMEKDYFGALLGGILFAFFALPHIGLTYTPLILGSVNFAVASLVLWRFFALIKMKKTLLTGFGCVLFALTAFCMMAEPVITYGEQSKYQDKIIYSRQTPYQKIVITRWKSYYWLYLNGQEQFSTFDEEKYHEPLVHPVMNLTLNTENILILGGGDGLALREVIKYDTVKSVTLVDLDPAMTRLAETHPILIHINQDAFSDPRVTVINADASKFLADDEDLYGVIIVDLPDPDSIDLMHLYSQNFYSTIRKHLIKGGIMVTQATSPIFSGQAFRCILKTMHAAGLTTLPYHNPIPTMGEWGWIIGCHQDDTGENDLKERMMRADYLKVATRFLNKDAVISMLHFGKGVMDPGQMADVKINTQINPILYRYYLKGKWDVY